MRQSEITQDRNAYRFRTEVRVRLSETDAVGIVFFGSFSAYMDVGRMDYLNHLGLTRHGGLVRDLAPGAVVEAEQCFHSPARYNDVLEIHVRMAEIGRTSYTFHYLMMDKRQPRVVATGKMTLVWLNDDFQPTPIPEDFRSAVTSFEGVGCSQSVV
jgi:acyl-CoA thioester hydrolase